MDHKGFFEEASMPTKLELIQGDITQMKADAIINAANPTLLGGGGVDGAIHRKAGFQLRIECATLGGCKTGEAKITQGYRLPARHVIHTVGPVWGGGDLQESELLARCYQNCFAVAHFHQLKTLAFPSISTGAFGYPVEKACRIALKEMYQAIRHYPELEKIIVVCFDSPTFLAYRTAMEESAN
jgi:O-acetyl-ADP-ribose deacetylase (regulator of RNase III)